MAAAHGGRLFTEPAARSFGARAAKSPVRTRRARADNPAMNRTSEGGRWVVELRPGGIARWISAAFLSFWLVGWAMGEIFGLTLLAGGLGIHLDRLPFRTPTAGGAPLLLFALVWTSFWTLGGVLAIAQVLQLLWGADRLEYDGAGVRRLSRVGPFARSRYFPREEIRAFRLLRSRLVLETRRGAVTLTRLGSRADQLELKSDLERALALGAEPPPLAQDPPAGWESGVDLEGSPVLRRSPALRRRQAAWVWLLFAALAAAVWSQVAKAMAGAGPLAWAPVVFLSLFMTAAGAGAAWLTLGGEAIRLAPGRAEIHRWFGSKKWVQALVPVQLELVRTIDSDNDERYALVIEGADGRKSVARAIDDPFELLQLARWMAAKLNCELRLPPELRTKSDAA